MSNENLAFQKVLETEKPVLLSDSTFARVYKVGDYAVRILKDRYNETTPTTRKHADELMRDHGYLVDGRNAGGRVVKSFGLAAMQDPETGKYVPALGMEYVENQRDSGWKQRVAAWEKQVDLLGKVGIRVFDSEPGRNTFWNDGIWLYDPQFWRRKNE